MEKRDIFLEAWSQSKRAAVAHVRVRFCKKKSPTEVTLQSGFERKISVRSEEWSGTRLLAGQFTNNPRRATCNMEIGECHVARHRCVFDGEPGRDLQCVIPAALSAGAC